MTKITFEDIDSEFESQIYDYILDNAEQYNNHLTIPNYKYTRVIEQVANELDEAGLIDCTDGYYTITTTRRTT